MATVQTPKQPAPRQPRNGASCDIANPVNSDIRKPLTVEAANAENRKSL